MKNVSKFYASFFDEAVDLRICTGIDKLKDFFVFNQFVFNCINFVLVLFKVFPNNIGNMWIDNFFTV